MNLKNKIKGNFEIFERIYSSQWFYSSYNALGFIRDFPKIGGGNFITKVIFIMENSTCLYLFDKEEFERAANFTADKLLNNDKWRLKIYGKIESITKKYFDAGESLRKLNLDSLSNTKLIRIIKKIIELQHWHQVYSILVNGIIIDGRNHLSNKIRDELSLIMGNPEDFGTKWSLLTQVTKMSLRQRKEHSIALLAEDIKKMSQEEVKKKIRVLHGKYCWLDYNNMGPAASIENFEKELREAQKNNKHLDLPKKLKEIKEKQDQLIKSIKLNKRGKFLVKLAQGVIWQKGYRKDMQYHGWYCYENLFHFLNKKSSHNNWQTFDYLFPWELEEFILNSKPSIKELDERRKYSCHIVLKNKKFLKIGKNAKSFIKTLNLNENFLNINEIKGQCAFAGKVKGIVKIIQVPSDINKMNQGDILVSQATSPDLMLAIKKAGAIVTNTGGLICHAAITSRELKIPCVVGTAKATLVLKDGDFVEVDANKGIVKKIK